MTIDCKQKKNDEENCFLLSRQCISKFQPWHHQVGVSDNEASVLLHGSIYRCRCS